jgi:hypothetical protein
MEQLWAISSCRSPTPNHSRRTYLILRMDNLLAGKSDPPCLKQDQVPVLLSSAARPMKNLSQNNSGHVNNDSGPGSSFIHFPSESLFTSPRNLY